MFSWVCGLSHTKPNTWETEAGELQRVTDQSGLGLSSSQASLSYRERDFRLKQWPLFFRDLFYNPVPVPAKIDRGIDNKQLPGGQM